MSSGDKFHLELYVYIRARATRKITENCPTTSSIHYLHRLANFTAAGACVCCAVRAAVPAAGASKLLSLCYVPFRVCMYVYVYAHTRARTQCTFTRTFAFIYICSSSSRAPISLMTETNLRFHRIFSLTVDTHALRMAPQRVYFYTLAIYKKSAQMTI